MKDLERFIAYKKKMIKFWLMYHYEVGIDELIIGSSL